MALRLDAFVVTGLLLGCGPTAELPDQSSGDTLVDSSDDDDDADDDASDPTDTGGPGTDDGSDGDDAHVGSDTSGGDTSGGDTSGDAGDDDATETGGPAGVCPDDGQFGLTVTGSDLNAYDGMLVWAAAVQPEGLGQDVEHVVVVNLEETIADGAFELTCPAGLDENTNYPSLAAIIDADATGACSDGDVGVILQLFGWLDAQTLAVEPVGLVAVGDMNPFDGSSACEYFFSN